MVTNIAYEDCGWHVENEGDGEVKRVVPTYGLKVFIL